MNLFKELWYTERYTAETMNLDRFQNRYFEMKRLDKAARGYESLKTSRIRERALTGMALAVGRQDQDAPELAERPLSPELSALSSQRLTLRRGALERYRQQIESVRRQDADADADAIAFSKMSPLAQSKRRDGWYRVSELDRMAAIAGLLRRERRRTAPLTREALRRAKSIDAARGPQDEYVVTDADLERAAAGPLLSADYAAYQLRERHRRETMFAKSEIVAGGYPGFRGSGSAAVYKELCNGSA